jgi:hypothetical protein
VVRLFIITAQGAMGEEKTGDKKEGKNERDNGVLSCPHEHKMRTASFSFPFFFFQGQYLLFWDGRG